MLFFLVGCWNQDDEGRDWEGGPAQEGLRAALRL